MRGALLALDASTYVGSAAVLVDGKVLAAGETPMRGKHEERLMPLVVALLREAGVEARTLDAVACGGGPGSFTSLRIAASIAKGVATGAGCALHAMPSLALIAANAPTGAGRFLAALDAMRGESYVQLFARSDEDRVRAVGLPSRIDTAAIAALAMGEGALPIGPGLPGDVHPHARGVRCLLDGEGEGGLLPRVALASWEPDYGRLAEAQVKWEATHGRSLHGER
jgi:tRNA threonylcarbamoyladenosine biosynthesis protein TsaB